MRRSGLLLTVVLVVAASLPSYAGDRLGVGVKTGTLGVGVDLTVRVTDRFSVRGSLNGLNVSLSETISDVDYDANLKLGATGVLLDFHPFKGNFRLSAGLMRNRNGFDLSAKPSSDVKIGDTTYTPAQVGTLRGGVDFNSTVPYFGLGFGNAAKAPGRIRYVLDVGVLTQGSGDVRLSSSKNLVSQTDLKKEEGKVDDEIKKFKVWPVITSGISFRL